MKKKIPLKINRPFVFVPMTLDFLHIGHVNILNHAKKYGNIILGLVTDRGIRTYKRNNPINNYATRKKFAKMLKNIEHIIPVESLEDIISLVKIYKFNYVVHGDDWKKGPQTKTRKELIKTVKAWKGKVIDVPYTKNISSTKIINEL